MRILALDCATKTGFAHSCGISGTWDLRVLRNESSGMRLIRLRGKLNEIKQNVGVDMIVPQAVHVRFVRAAEPLIELRGTVKLWCEDNGANFDGDYKPSEIKKIATGKGNASKEAMIAEARVLKWDVSDDNEADAL